MECWNLYDTLTRLNLIDIYKQSCFAAGRSFFAAGVKLVCRGSWGELVWQRRGRIRKGVKGRTCTEVKLPDIFVG